VHPSAASSLPEGDATGSRNGLIAWLATPHGSGEQMFAVGTEIHWSNDWAQICPKGKKVIPLDDNGAWH